MSNNNEIRIKFKIDSDTKEIVLLNKEVKNLGGSFNNADTFANTFMKRINIAGHIYAGYQALNHTLGDIYSTGIQVNRSMQSLTNSLATSIAMTSANVDSMGRLISINEKYTMATTAAKISLQELLEINAETPHTLDQTVKIYDAMYIGMKRIGASSEDIIDLTKRLSIAVGNKVSFEAMLSAMDGLSTGTVEVASDMGRFLSNIGLTNEAIKNSSDVIALFKDKLKDVKSIENFDTKLSNLKNSYNLLAAEITQTTFNGIEDNLKPAAEILDSIKANLPAISNGASEIAHIGISIGTVALAMKGYSTATNIATASNIALTGSFGAVNRSIILATASTKIFSSVLKATPVGLATAAIYGISESFFEASKRADVFRKSLTEVSSELDVVRYKERLQEVNNELKEMDKKFANYNNTQKMMYQGAYNLAYKEKQKLEKLIENTISKPNGTLVDSFDDSAIKKLVNETLNPYQAGLDEINKKWQTHYDLMSKNGKDTSLVKQAWDKELEIYNAKQDSTKEQAKALEELNQAYLEIAQIGLSEYDKKVLDINLKIQSWIQSGMPLNEALAAQQQLINEIETSNDSIDSLIKANDQYMSLLDSQIALSESALDWNANLEGVANNIQNIAKSTMSLGTLEKKTEKEKLKAQKEFYKLTKDLATDSQEYKDAEITLSKQLNAINEASIQSQIDGYGSLVGAMSAMFDEGSKEAEALIGIQKALSIVTGITAIANAMASGDGYTAVARGLAVAATLASFGWEGSGSSGSSDYARTIESPNVTTVHGGGDKQSTSLENSLSILEDFAEPQFKELTKMAAYLKSIDQNIKGISSNVIRTGEFALGVGATESQTSWKNDFIGKNDKNIIERAFTAVGAGIFDKFLGVLSPVSLVNKVLGAIGLGGGGYNWQKLAGAGISFGSSNVQAGSTYSASGSYYGDVRSQQTFTAQTLENLINDFEGLLFQSQAYESMNKSRWGSASYSYWSTTTYKELDKELSNALSLTFKNIRDSIVTSSDILTVDVEEALNKMVVDIGNLSLQGLNGDKLTEKLQNTFSEQADKFVDKLYAGTLDDFQAIGEGIYETLIRVASGINVAEYYINRLGYAFENIKYTDITAKQGDVSLNVLAQSIVKFDEAVYGINNGVVQMVQTFNGSAEELFETYTLFEDIRNMLSPVGKEAQYLTSDMLLGAGGTAEFAKALEDYFNTVLNDQQKLTFQTQQMQKEFDKLNLVMPTSIEGFKSLFDSIDESTAEGQELLGRIVLLSDEYTKLIDDTKDMFYTQIENALDLQNLSIEVFNSAISAVKTMSSNFTKLEESISKTVTKLLSNSDGADAQEELIKTFWDTRAKIDTYLLKDGDLTDSEASTLSSLVSELNSLASGIQSAQDGDNTAITNSLVSELQNLQAEINFDNEILRVKVLDSSGNETDVASVGVISALQETLAGISTDALSLLSFKNGGNDLTAANEITFRGAFEAQSALSFADELNTLRNNLAYINLESVDASHFFDELKALDLNAFENMIEFFNAIGAINDNQVMVNGQLVNLPSYDVGSPYITHDQYALIHQGEMVLDRDFSNKLRRYGIPAVGGNMSIDLGLVIKELESTREIIKAQANEIQKLRKATESVEAMMLTKNYEGVA
ncbi:MAG: hypothetical protein AB7D96_10715 [Arcobacteraceae bacterium]